MPPVFVRSRYSVITRPPDSLALAHTSLNLAASSSGISASQRDSSKVRGNSPSSYPRSGPRSRKNCSVHAPSGPSKVASHRRSNAPVDQGAEPVLIAANLGNDPLARRHVPDDRGGHGAPLRVGAGGQADLDLQFRAVTAHGRERPRLAHLAVARASCPRVALRGMRLAPGGRHQGLDGQAEQFIGAAAEHPPGDVIRFDDRPGPIDDDHGI